MKSNIKPHHLVRLGSHEAKLSFYLNLYHLMIGHAFLVFGTPDNFMSLARVDEITTITTV